MSTNAAPNLAVMMNQAKKLQMGKLDLEVSYMTVLVLMVFGFVYMTVAAVGIDTYSKCESMKGKTVQENLNKYLAATLTIALTIPFTLLITKLFKNESQVFLMIYALMGIVGSAAALNWSVNCKDVDESVKVYSGVTLSSFICTLLISTFLMTTAAKSSTKIA